MKTPKVICFNLRAWMSARVWSVTQLRSLITEADFIIVRTPDMRYYITFNHMFVPCLKHPVVPHLLKQSVLPRSVCAPLYSNILVFAMYSRYPVVLHLLRQFASSRSVSGFLYSNILVCFVMYSIASPVLSVSILPCNNNNDDGNNNNKSTILMTFLILTMLIIFIDNNILFV